MLLTVDVLEVDVLEVDVLVFDVLELDVLGARLDKDSLIQLYPKDHFLDASYVSQVGNP